MKQLIKRLVLWAVDDPQSEAEIRTEPRESPFNADSGFLLRVFPATGGTIIEARLFDHSKMGINRTSLYIVRDDQNLAQELAKIITVQGLKQ